MPAKPLSQALRDYGRIADVQIIFTEDLVRGRTAPGLKGDFTPTDALQKLLEGTGLRAEKTPSGAVMILRAGDAPPTDADGTAPSATETATDRSEEHTSELQSLMRISYAVFCLKKKKQTKTNTHRTHT